jgi:hypothetical protein
MIKDIIYKNKFKEYHICIYFVLSIILLTIIFGIGRLWILGIFLLIFYLGFAIEYLKIYLYNDTLIIKRPLRLFSKPNKFMNCDITKIVYEIKSGRDSPKITIYTFLSKEKGKSFRFINSGREMQRFFTALEGLGIVVEYPTPDA